MSFKSSNIKQLLDIMDEYKIGRKEQNEILKVIKPICLHPEFQKRFSKDYPHHGNTSISKHILEDTIKTYVISKKKRKKNFSIEMAMYIALFHDLYMVPYQNNKEAKVNKFKNIHGFRHPVEAVVNSYSWYPDIYKKYDANILIDGIIHHMYPFPVMVVTDNIDNSMELKNYDLYQKLPDDIKNIMIEVTKRRRIGAFSIARSKYREGRIMSRADKYVSIKQLKNIYDWIALLTGKNKGLTK